jgi:cobalt-zinc-cadmium efflux system outer membrane protein
MNSSTEAGLRGRCYDFCRREQSVAPCAPLLHLPARQPATARLRRRLLRRGCPAIAASVALLLSGCVSTSSESDVRDAAALAAGQLPPRSDGTAVLPDWQSSWNAPPQWDGIEPLSADLAVTLALTRHRDLRAAVNEIVAARAEVATAQTPPNPMIAFAYGFPMDGGPGGMITASAMTQLSWLWQRPREVAAAEARLRERILRAADLALATAALVRERHLDLVAAEELHQLAWRAATAAEERAQLARELAGRGVISDAELRAMEIEAGGALRDALKVETEVHHAKVMLLAEVGLAEMPLDWQSDGRWPEAPAVDDPESLALTASQRRLDVAALAAALLAADEEARRAGLAGLPELELGVMFERSVEGMPTLGPAVNVSVPLFNRGDAEKAKAFAAREAARLALDSAMQAACTTARLEAMEWLAAERTWREGSEPTRQAAERRAIAAVAEHAAGAGSRLSACEATTMFAERSMRATEDRAQALRAAIRFERAVGGLPRSTQLRSTDEASDPGVGEVLTDSRSGGNR